MRRLLEELTWNAWPALETVYYDGWLLRFANGHTRRPNSVNAMYPSALPLREKIAYCEQVYAARGRPTIFKLLDAVQPPELDATLDDLGYERTGDSFVKTMSLENLLPAPDGLDVQITVQPPEGWVETFCRLNGFTEDRVNTVKEIIRRIVPKSGYTAVVSDGQVIGIGLGVVEHGYIGLYDIVIDAAWRGQGVGKHMLHHLLAWGKANGAHSSYLQVSQTNPPALRLYESLGFRTQYEYWYRVKPE